MTNVSTSVSADGTRLTIEVDLTEDHGPTKTKKSNIVANSHGWNPVHVTSDHEFDLNLLLVKKAR